MAGEPEPPVPPTPRSRPAPAGNVRSSLSGTAGQAVQARDVHGGIHFHVPAARPPLPVVRQLPVGVHGFVDRTTERRLLDRSLTECPSTARIVVVTGTAGVGKTSLALHWAHAVRERFPDGQLYADLHGYDRRDPVRPEQALERFLRALGTPAASIPPDAEHMAAAFRSLLADRRLLLLLDNAATAAQVRPLLPAAPGCVVIVTSRRRLTGLAVREGARHLTLNVLDEDAAVELLHRVTCEHRPGDDPAQMGRLARLCARLPLALRIAAERAACRPLMRLEDLIDDLRDASGPWVALSPDGHEESEAVRTVFAWSYQALSADAARLFRLLGLHVSGEFSDAAAAALADADTRTARRLLDEITSAHMAEQTAPGRFRLHGLLHAYAADRAHAEESLPEREAARQRLLLWYLRTADAVQAQVAPHEPRVAPAGAEEDVPVPSFADYAAAMRWYEAERDNLVAAVRLAALDGRDRIAWQLAVVLRAVYMLHSPFQDWITTSRLGLEAARRDGDRNAEAELHESLGMAYTQSQRLSDAAEHYEAALDLRRFQGDASGEALTLNGLGWLEMRRRNLEAARAAFERSRSLFADLGDSYWEPRVAVNLAEAELELGRPENVTDLVRQGIEVFRAHGDRRAEGNALHVLAAVERETGRAEAALAHAGQAVDIAAEIGSSAAEGYWLLQLGHAQRAVGRPGEALASYQRAAVLQRELGDRIREAASWDGAGQAHRELGRPREAAGLHRRAADACRELRDHWRAARALAHLAAALHAVPAPDEAARATAEALGLLEEFGDPRALRLREHLTGAPAGRTEES